VTGVVSEVEAGVPLTIWHFLQTLLSPVQHPSAQMNVARVLSLADSPGSSRLQAFLFLGNSPLLFPGQ
jgi:hypothetical protein